MSTAEKKIVVQVTAETGKKPRAVAQLSDWQYLERSFQRLICGWGRWFADWQDKVVISRQIWEQAEAVQRIRDRLAEFPGTTHNLEAPVSARLEHLVNTVLQAPSHEDAVDGIYQVLLEGIVRSYIGYAEHTHSIHDAPTLALVQDLVRLKEQQRLWLRDYRRRRPHATDANYREKIEIALAELGHLQDPIPVDESAQPSGIRTDFRLLARARHPRATEPPCNWTPFMYGDFAHDLEARRLFWCYGYMLEMNLAEDQLRWIYDSSDMPWEFTRDLSRHLWDESRHGDSGHSRLLDFGIDLSMVGYGFYGDSSPSFEGESERHDTVEPLTAEQLYDQIFVIGMVAETGHFTVKREAYEDFKAAGDMESAEMVLFDVIDETSHVQYAHKWLPMLAERCGKDPSEFKARGVEERQRHQEAATARQKASSELPRSLDDPGYAHYRRLIEIMREKQPLQPIPHELRSYLPM